MVPIELVYSQRKDVAQCLYAVAINLEVTTMNDINVSLLIKDKCCSKCSSSIRDIERVITSYTEYIALQDCFTLKILSVTANYAVISIDNGTIYFVRKLYVGVPILICLPNTCNTHILQITAKSL